MYKFLSETDIYKAVFLYANRLGTRQLTPHVQPRKVTQGYVECEPGCAECSAHYRNNEYIAHHLIDPNEENTK